MVNNIKGKLDKGQARNFVVRVSSGELSEYLTKLSDVSAYGSK